MNKFYFGVELKVNKVHILENKIKLGIEKDYYIALGLNFRGVYEFPTKTFYFRYIKFHSKNKNFFSSNDFKFSPLPPIDSEYKEKIDSFRTPFIGKHEEILILVAEAEG